MFRLASLTGQFAQMALTPQVSTVQQCRLTSFFARLPAEQIWKGVTSVSNAGRKRGRAAGNKRKVAVDLNKGQIHGVGKINMVWPGLNSPVIRGKEIVTTRTMKPDPDREERILANRVKGPGWRKMKLSPMERGWSGTKIGGRSIGRPDAVGEEKFEDFKSCVVQMRMMTVMQSMGKQRTHKCIVIVGNGNGLMGFARGRSSDARSALKQAKNKAVKSLTYFERFEEHTVLHDFYAEWGSCKLIVKKKQHGFGLVCQRVVREMCKVIGIKDLYVKADNRRMHTLSVIRAFLLGLHSQRSLQSIAEEKRLHLIELRPEYDYFPKVVASPKEAPVRTESEILPKEELDVNMIISGGKLLMPIKKKEPFYWKLPCYEIYKKKTDPFRNQRQVHLRILKRYGALKSFLTIREEQEKQKQLTGAE